MVVAVLEEDKEALGKGGENISIFAIPFCVRAYVTDCERQGKRWGKSLGASAPPRPLEHHLKDFPRA
jgi:hypothetical protein